LRCSLFWPTSTGCSGSLFCSPMQRRVIHIRLQISATVPPLHPTREPGDLIHSKPGRPRSGKGAEPQLPPRRPLLPALPNGLPQPCS
jgi:hypothetical protein